MAYSFEPSIQNNVFNPDQLIAGSFDIVTATVTLSSGLNLTRGTLIGQITATGYYKVATAGASDGSQLPANWVILAEDTNTSASGTNANTACPVYLAGEFDTNYMTIDSSITVAVATADLRPNSIFLKTGLSNAIV